MVTNTPKRHQKYAMPKFECRPRPLWSSIAHAPVTMAARPNRTWMPTPARKSGLVDGIGMPKSTVISGGIGFHSVFYIGPRFAGVGSAASTIATISATSHGRSVKRAAKAQPRGLRRRSGLAARMRIESCQMSESGSLRYFAALRLASRRVVALLPQEPEALGLLALMLHAEARSNARRGRNGGYVPLAEQDPAAWDLQMTEEAEALLRRASAMGSIGRYQLEAAVQSAHAARRRAGRADWAAIERLYGELYAITGSPVVAINRAVALGETCGPAAGLAVLDELSIDKRLADYQPYWAARAGLLAGTGEIAAAEQAYDRAIGLERDPAVRRFLQQRRAALA